MWDLNMVRKERWTGYAELSGVKISPTHAQWKELNVALCPAACPGRPHTKGGSLPLRGQVAPP